MSHEHVFQPVELKRDLVWALEGKKFGQPIPDELTLACNCGAYKTIEAHKSETNSPTRK